MCGRRRTFSGKAVGLYYAPVRNSGLRPVIWKKYLRTSLKFKPDNLSPRWVLMNDTKLNHARLYTAQIHRYFLARSGKPPVLTLDDWTCIRKWREEGIPVEYVLNGIDRAFLMGSAPVKCLSDCAPAVREEWRYKLCS